MHVTVISPTRSLGIGENDGLYTHLGVEPIGPSWVPDPGCSIGDAFDGDRTGQVQSEVNRIKLCNSASE